jgi:hypothetical protein
MGHVIIKTGPPSRPESGSGLPKLFIRHAVVGNPFRPRFMGSANRSSLGARGGRWDGRVGWSRHSRAAGAPFAWWLKR